MFFVSPMHGMLPNDFYLFFSSLSEFQWFIGTVNGGDSGNLEIVCNEYEDEDQYFPIQITFTSENLYSGLEVTILCSRILFDSFVFLRLQMWQISKMEKVSILSRRTSYLLTNFTLKPRILVWITNKLIRKQRFWRQTFSEIWQKFKKGFDGWVNSWNWERVSKSSRICLFSRCFWLVVDVFWGKHYGGDIAHRILIFDFNMKTPGCFLQRCSNFEQMYSQTYWIFLTSIRELSYLQANPSVRTLCDFFRASNIGMK